MPFPGAQRKIEFEDGPVIVFGTKATRAAVQAEFPTVPIGSIYISSVNTGETGRVYLKTAVSTWEKITSSGAD